MLLVKTRLRPSPIEGLGLFAAQFIPKGTVVWKFDPLLDHLVDAAALEGLHPVERDFMARYAYLNSTTRKWVVCVDDARFMNHSSKPNLVSVYPPGEVEGVDVAAWDIAEGEEITTDYLTFDADAKNKLGP